MGQVLHGCATTTEAIRRAIQNSQESLRALSKRYTRLNSSAEPLNIACTYAHRGSASRCPFLELNVHIDHRCLAARGDACLVLIKALLDTPSAKIGRFAVFFDVVAATHRKLSDGIRKANCLSV